MKKITSKIAVAAITVFALPTGANYLRGQWIIHSLTQAQGQADDGRPRFPQDPATLARWRRFDALWQARKKREVTTQIVPFLSDPFPPLRIRAARALGRLEDPKAQAPLQKVLSRMRTENDEYKEGGIPAVTLNLALGRIASHGLKGKAKISRMVRQVGLTWPNLMRLSQTVNGSERHQMQETSGKEIIDEVIDLLYTMGQRGERIDPIAQQLALLPSQKVWIQASSRNLNGQSKLIIDYLFHLHVIRNDDYDLVRHLVELGPVATSAILSRLQDMKRNPQKYPSLEPYPGSPGAYRSLMGASILFSAAALTGDKRMIPLLKHFQKSSDLAIRRAAIVSLQTMQQ